MRKDMGGKNDPNHGRATKRKSEHHSRTFNLLHGVSILSPVPHHGWYCPLYTYIGVSIRVAPDIIYLRSARFSAMNAK